MELERAIKIAKREWENIRVSLEKSGDIGELDFRFNSDISSILISGGPYLIINLIKMDEKLSSSGYNTKEATHVFTHLASKAAENLGLRGRLAQTFGSGYTWVRTGWFCPSSIEEQDVVQLLLFFKIFFPLGGNVNWSFDSPTTKTKLKLVSYTFLEWQKDPDIYTQDVRDYNEQIQSLWCGLTQTMRVPKVEAGDKKYRHQSPSWNFQNLFSSI
ncbi:MAG TPA: hypothetical protein VLB01_06910 [Thermodesulfobacteriota bacterium]|nr:hypothetical protein [Thermodesulfobacteriota bacterium]